MARKNCRLYISIASDELKSLLISVRSRGVLGFNKKSKDGKFINN